MTIAKHKLASILGGHIGAPTRTITLALVEAADTLHMTVVCDAVVNPVASNIVVTQLTGPVLHLTLDSDVPAYLGIRAGSTTAYTEIPWRVSGVLGTTGLSIDLTPIDTLADGTWHYQFRLQTPSGGGYTSGDFTIDLGSMVVLRLINDPQAADSAVFADTSNSGHAVSNPGSAGARIQWNALNHPSDMATWARLFGTSRHLAVAAGSGDFAFPNGTAFTIEGRAFFNAFGFCFINDPRVTGTEVATVMLIDGTGHLRCVSNNSTFDETTPNAFPTGVPVHFAWSRTEAGVSYVAMNGLIEASGADANDYPDLGAFLFEDYEQSGYAFCGDGFGPFRITRGEALYTGIVGASYVIPTFPFT